MLILIVGSQNNTLRKDCIAMEKMHKKPHQRRCVRMLALIWCATTAGIALLAPAATAAGFPERAIQIIVPYPPGGATDTLARTIGQKISESLNQSVVVENRPGASGNIGMQAAARAPADGYTILFSAVSDAGIYKAISPSQSVHLLRDFAPLAGVANGPHILVVPDALPIQNLKELIAYLKATPGKYNFASIGIGTLSHLEGELLMLTAGVNIVHVPYKGGAQALIDLISGNSSLMFLSGPNAMPHVKSGKLRVLAVAGNQRLPSLPGVPTIEEAGVKGFEANNFFGFNVPKGTPAATISILTKAIEAAMAAPDVRQRLETLGLIPKYFSPEEFGRMAENDFRVLESIVKSAKIKIE